MGDIKGEQRIRKLRDRLNSLRAKGGIKSSEVESLAQALGRRKDARGKEPTWVNPGFPRLRPLAIPHHSSDLNKFTARGILDQLEEDLEALEELTRAEEEN